MNMGLNRKLVRATYPRIDWDQYDREVIAESLPDYEAAVEALESVLRFVRPEYLSDEGAIETARAALARLRESEAAHVG